MKKSSMVIAICAALIVLCALLASFIAGSLSRSEAEVKISKEQARQIALQDAGTDPDETTFTRNALEAESDHPIYLVEFYTDDASYKYRIDGMTGSISRKDEKTVIRKAAAGDNDDVETVTDRTGSETDRKDGENQSQTGDQNPDYPISTENKPGEDDAMNYIGVKRAQQIALADAGFAAEEVTFEKSSLDHEKGRVVYEVEFKVGMTEYEYDIDANDGSIVDKDIDKD